MHGRERKGCMLLGSQKKGCQAVSMMQRKWQTTLPMTTPRNKSIVLHKIQNSSFIFVQSYNVQTTATKMQSFTSFMISHKLQNAVTCKSCILRHFSRCETKPMAYEQKTMSAEFPKTLHHPWAIWNNYHQGTCRVGMCPVSRIARPRKLLPNETLFWMGGIIAEWFDEQRAAISLLETFRLNR